MTDASGPADVVVIGAGVGGLTCAARLARNGLNVVLLEQDGRVGGTAGAYVRSGFTIPAGPLGVTVPDFILSTLELCGVAEPPSWTRQRFRLSTDHLDIEISAPLEVLGEILCSQFPAERDGIRKSVDLLQQGIQEIRRARNEYRTPDLPGEPADAVFRRLLREESLIRLFSGQGAERSTASFSVMVRMWDFLSETGIWTPSCGIHGLTLLLKTAFESSGGRLLTHHGAGRILVESGRAIGVQLSNGAILDARAVVSNGDSVQTLTRLIDPSELADGDVNSFRNRSLSGSLLSVAAGLPSSPGTWPVLEENLLYTRTTGEPIPWNEGTRAAPDAFLHDAIWINRSRGRQPSGFELLVIRVDAPYEFFLPFRNAERPHKPGYDRLKQDLGYTLLQAAAHAVPSLSGPDVRILDVATPLTYEFWGHRRQGSVAGWAWNAPQVEDLTRTSIAGLHLVGILGMSPLVLGGMGTAMFTGLRVADRILARSPD